MFCILLWYEKGNCDSCSFWNSQTRWRRNESCSCCCTYEQTFCQFGKINHHWNILLWSLLLNPIISSSNALCWTSTTLMQMTKFSAFLERNVYDIVFLWYFEDFNRNVSNGNHRESVESRIHCPWNYKNDRFIPGSSCPNKWWRNCSIFASLFSPSLSTPSSSLFSLLSLLLFLSLSFESFFLKHTQICDETTVRSAQKRFSFAPLQPVEIKGLSDKFKIYSPYSFIHEQSLEANFLSNFLSSSPHSPLLASLCPSRLPPTFLCLSHGISNRKPGYWASSSSYCEP